MFKKGVPAVMQWVNNLTAAAPVTVEALVQSLAPCSGLKDPVLLQLGVGHSGSSDLIPRLQTSICCRYGH